MNKNEIALSFEQAEYYTLQEACDYLNMKHKINNITPKKLLKYIIGYFVPCYVFVHNIRAIIEADFFDSHLCDDEKNEYLKKFQDDFFIGSLMGVWVQLSFKDLLLICNRCDGKAIVTQFDDYIKLLRFRAFYNDDTLEEAHIQLYWNKILDNENINKLKEQSNLKFTTYTQDKCNFYPQFEISINNLTVFHTHLDELEKNIINNDPMPQSQLQIQPIKGKSAKKILANEQAKIIAKALWNNDKDNKIRIKEMANIVYSELYNSGFMRDLPNDPISLKEWIKDIAPPYATIGGRPKNEP